MLDPPIAERVLERRGRDPGDPHRDSRQPTIVRSQQSKIAVR
jgi:hypothetical protein